MSKDEYAEKIVENFMENITDHVFLNIQNNEALMREYQSQVHQHSLQSINTAIGKKVKEIFELQNKSESNQPASWLIKSYMKYTK